MTYPLSLLSKSEVDFIVECLELRRKQKKQTFKSIEYALRLKDKLLGHKKKVWHATIVKGFAEE